MMRKVLAGICAALAVGGCASYDGRELASGSTMAQVEAGMGQPAARATQPDGSTVLYYPRGPEGRHTYAVTIGRDGALRSIEQRLTLANFNTLMVGQSTTNEVRELFGPPEPYSRTKLALSQRDVWEYKWLDYQEKRVFWFQFSDDGVLRESMNSRDDFHESPGAGLP